MTNTEIQGLCHAASADEPDADVLAEGVLALSAEVDRLRAVLFDLAARAQAALPIATDEGATWQTDELVAALNRVDAER